MRAGPGRPLAPGRDQDHRPGPADLAEQPQHPELDDLAAGTATADADPQPARARRAPADAGRRRQRDLDLTSSRARPAALLEFLESMKFMLRVEAADVTRATSPWSRSWDRHAEPEWLTGAAASLALAYGIGS